MRDALALALLFAVLALPGCATTAATCTTDGRPVLTHRTFVRVADVKVSCYVAPNVRMTARARHQAGSPGLWQAIGGLFATAMLFVANDPPQAPDLRVDEEGPLEALEPKAPPLAPRARPAQVALEPRWTAPGALVCGGVAQPAWCYP